MRNHKDRLFRYIFKDKGRLLELYNAVSGNDYQNPEELEINTLEDVIYLGMKNDLSFLIGAEMNLYEHQSTWNRNMPLRGLFYLSHLYQGFIESTGADIYAESLIPLPCPRFLIFYNGPDKHRPARTTLRLSEAFLAGHPDSLPCLECTATVLNINEGYNDELMERCRPLYEYTWFISRIRQYAKTELNLETAMELAIDDSIEAGILLDLLQKNRAEVKDLLLTEYDEEKHLKNVKDMGWTEGCKQISLLFQKLLKDNRFSDLERASVDREYQKQLLSEYNIW